MAGGLFDTKRISEWIGEKVEALDSTDAELLLTLSREYLHRVRYRIGLIVVMIAIISATTASVALLVKDVVNVVFVEQDSSLLILLVVAILLIFTAKGATTYYQNVISARISNEIVADVQKRLFAHLLSQNLTVFANNTSDKLLMIFNQGANGFGSILTTVMINGVRDLALVVSLIAVMIYQDTFLALACLVVGPPVYFGVVKLLGKVKGLMELELAGYAELYKRVRETAQGITVIKSFNLEPTAYNGGSDVVEGLRQRMDRIAALQAAPLPLLEMAGGFAVACARDR